MNELTTCKSIICFLIINNRRKKHRLPFLPKVLCIQTFKEEYQRNYKNIPTKIELKKQMRNTKSRMRNKEKKIIQYQQDLEIENKILMELKECKKFQDDNNKDNNKEDNNKKKRKKKKQNYKWKINL